MFQDKDVPVAMFVMAILLLLLLAGGLVWFVFYVSPTAGR